MPGTDRARPTDTREDSVLKNLLEDMLERNEDITFRSAARKHPDVTAPSSITRIAERRQLVEEYQARQEKYREWHARAPKASRDGMAAQLAGKDVRIAELERQNEILRASHAAMIRIVGELGGISKLLKLYERFREFRSELEKMAAIPRCDVIELKLPSGKKRR